MHAKGWLLGDVLPAASCSSSPGPSPAPATGANRICRRKDTNTPRFISLAQLDAWPAAASSSHIRNCPIRDIRGGEKPCEWVSLSVSEDEASEGVL